MEKSEKRISFQIGKIEKTWLSCIFLTPEDSVLKTRDIQKK